MKRWKPGYPPAVQGVYLVQLYNNDIEECKISYNTDSLGNEGEYLILEYGNYSFDYHTHKDINKKRSENFPGYCIKRHMGPFKFPSIGKPRLNRKPTRIKKV